MKNKHITTKAEKYPIEIHNAMSHMGGGVGWACDFESVIKCSRGWKGV